MSFSDSLFKFMDRHFGRGRPVFDPATLRDPVAERVDWSPMDSDGRRFPSHGIHEVSPFRMEWAPSWGTRIAGCILVLLGIAIYGATVRSDLRGTASGTEWLFGLVFGTLPLAGGGWMLSRARGRHVFDKREGTWWFGKVPPSRDPSLFDRDLAGRLSDIHAIQFLVKRVGHYSSTNDSSWDCYEINLVFHNRDRYSLANQAGEGSRRDAEELARFLEVPFWTPGEALRPFDPTRDRTPIEEAGGIPWPPPGHRDGVGGDESSKAGTVPSRDVESANPTTLEPRPKSVGILTLRNAILFVMAFSTIGLINGRFHRAPQPENDLEPAYLGIFENAVTEFRFLRNGQVWIRKVGVRCLEHSPSCPAPLFEEPREETATYRFRHDTVVIFRGSDSTVFRVGAGTLHPPGGGVIREKEARASRTSDVPRLEWIPSSEVPPAPDGSNAFSLASPDRPEHGDSFPVIHAKGMDFYPMSYADDRNSFDLVSYRAGQVLARRMIPGAHNVCGAYVDTTTRSLILQGQGGEMVLVPWTILR